ncbi:MAG: hypothetical protein KAI57_02530 [Candidatus Pacebacteria bacterium]|nr:hypothetical protein [Candidatus Paceibacterota bacterium]
MQTRRNNYRNSKFKKITVSQNIKNSEKILSVFLVFLICVIGLLYMSKTVSIATNGYDVKGFERQLGNLQRENQKMIIELADLKAIYNFESESSNLVAVENDNIEYIISSLGAVAMER